MDKYADSCDCVPELPDLRHTYPKVDGKFDGPWCRQDA